MSFPKCTIILPFITYLHEMVDQTSPIEQLYGWQSIQAHSLTAVKKWWFKQDINT